MGNKCESRIATEKSPLVAMTRAPFRIGYLIFSFKFCVVIIYPPIPCFYIFYCTICISCVGGIIGSESGKRAESSIWVEMTDTDQEQNIAFRCMMTRKCRSGVGNCLLSKNCKVISVRTKNRVWIGGNPSYVSKF